MAEADPTVTYAGWAYKEGSLVKNWKKRFLVVKRRELAYYKTTDHTSHHAQLMGAMRIARVEMAAGITNGLRVTSVEGRELKIFMDTAAERDRCFNAIAEWCHPGGASSSSSTTGAARARGAPPQQTASTTARGSTTTTHHGGGAARMTGWLEKQGQNMPTWKRRFFVLDEGILSYSTNEGSSSLGRHRVLGVRRDRTRPFTLELRLDTGRELRVSASSEHDLNDWQRALRETIQTSPAAHRRSDFGHESSTDIPTGERERPALDDSQASYNNLFGAPPAAQEQDANDNELVDARRSANMSFGHSIQLNFDGANTSFVESAPPAEKPWSPTAPGVDTIRRMRIDQHLLDSDDEDDFEITRVSSTQPSTSGSSSPVPSRRPRDQSTTRKKTKEEAAVGPGACCCVVM